MYKDRCQVIAEHFLAVIQYFKFQESEVNHVVLQSGLCFSFQRSTVHVMLKTASSSGEECSQNEELAARERPLKELVSLERLKFPVGGQGKGYRNDSTFNKHTV